MNPFRALPFAVLAALSNLCASCDGPDSADSQFELDDLTFVTDAGAVAAGSTAELALNPADGFPVRVLVKGSAPRLHGGVLKAHVLIPGALGLGSASGGAPSTDGTFTLAVDEKGNYSAVVTLNAPGPGAFRVEAEVVGKRKGIDGVIRAAEIVGNVQLLDWVGDKPRYTLCVATSAEKGTVDFASDGAAVFGSGVAASCELDATAKKCPDLVEPKPASHCRLLLATDARPADLRATLKGRPIAADPADWSAVLDYAEGAAGAGGTSGIGLAFLDPDPNTDIAAGGAGSWITVQAHATSDDKPAVGVTLKFTALSTSGDKESNVVPDSKVTDASGNADVLVFIPEATPVSVTVTGGNAQAVRVF